MSRVVTKDDCLAEIKRFLKYYFHFCKSPDPDSVREVLASAYSINDKFRKAGYQDFLMIIISWPLKQYVIMQFINLKYIMKPNHYH